MRLCHQVDRVRRSSGAALPARLPLSQSQIRYECSLKAVLGVKPKVRLALTTVKCLSCSGDSEKQSAQSG